MHLGEIRLAVDWLRLNPPAHPLPLETAKKLARHGGDRRSADQVGRSNLKGNTRAYWLARMERDGRADLLDLIERKEMSANAAMFRVRILRPVDANRCGAWLHANR
jgi:hypothetical protein